MNTAFQSGPNAGGFLPEDYVEKKTSQRSGLIGLFLFTVVMLGVLAAFLVTNRRWESIRQQQAEIQTSRDQEALKIEQLRTLEAQRKQMLDKAEIVSALVERAPRSLLLAELTTRLPENVTLSEVNLKSKRIEAAPVAAPTQAGQVQKVASIAPGGNPGTPGQPPAPPKPQAPKFEYSVVIVGIASENNDIADYLSALKNSALLKGVDLQYIQELSVEKIDMRQFEIRALLNADADPGLVVADRGRPAADSEPAPKAAADASMGTGAIEGGER